MGIFTVALLIRPVPLDSDAWAMTIPLEIILAPSNPNFYLKYNNEGSFGVCKNIVG